MDTITIREVTLKDAQKIYEAISSHREYLQEWLPFAATLLSVEEEERFLFSVVRVPREQRNFVYIIEDKKSICGLIGFHFSDWSNHRTEIGYWLLPEYQHRGIMTRCVRHLCRLAVEERGMNRIQIRCAVENIPSNAIPQRLGFRLEGIERDGELMITGKYVDLNVYSILKKEVEQMGITEEVKNKKLSK